PITEQNAALVPRDGGSRQAGNIEKWYGDDVAQTLVQIAQPGAEDESDARSASAGGIEQLCEGGSDHADCYRRRAVRRTLDPVHAARLRVRGTMGRITGFFGTDWRGGAGSLASRQKSIANAGTRNGRTKKVSIKTPHARAKPICISVLRPLSISVAKVPAMIKPQEVMAPPVLARATRMPSTEPCFLRSCTARLPTRLLYPSP